MMAKHPNYQCVSIYFRSGLQSEREIIININEFEQHSSSLFDSWTYQVEPNFRGPAHFQYKTRDFAGERDTEVRKDDLYFQSFANHSNLTTMPSN
jgi:hypothetical protein